MNFERIRRITGYLNKTEQFNNAKQKEEKDRVVHKEIEEDDKRVQRKQSN